MCPKSFLFASPSGTEAGERYTNITWHEHMIICIIAKHPCVYTPTCMSVVFMRLRAHTVIKSNSRFADMQGGNLIPSGNLWRWTYEKFTAWSDRNVRSTWSVRRWTRESPENGWPTGSHKRCEYYLFTSTYAIGCGTVQSKTPDVNLIKPSKISKHFIRYYYYYYHHQRTSLLCAAARQDDFTGWIK